MDNNLEDFHPTMEESCGVGSAESSPRRSKIKKNEWSDSRIIMPFVPLEAIKEEVTPSSSTQRLENNLSLIKNKLRSGSPAQSDQRAQLSTNTSVANCFNVNVVTADRVTNLNYTARRNNLYNIKSQIRTSSSRSRVNDARLSNIDSARGGTESNDEMEIYSGSRNINNTAPVKPARKSVNTSDRSGKTTNGDKNPISAKKEKRTLSQNILSKSSTPRSTKYNSCIDELKYYNVRNGLSKNPSEESSARKLSSQCDDELSNSGLTTSRTDCTDMSVSALFNNKESKRESRENSSGNNSTLDGKNNSLDVTEMSDFKHYLMHSDNKTSSTTNSMNLTESEPNSPDTPTDTSTHGKQLSTRGTGKVIKPKTELEKTRIPKKVNMEKGGDKNQSKDLPGNGVKYKVGVPKNNDLEIGTKKVRSRFETGPLKSTKLNTEGKCKDFKSSPIHNKEEDICSSSKSQTLEKPLKNSTQTKFKHDTTSKITKTTVDSKDIGDNATINGRKKNITIRRRYSMGESSVTNQNRHKKTVNSSGAQEKTRRTTTYINDNEKRQEEEPRTDLRRNDDDCYSKPSDMSLKSSSSLQILGSRVAGCPSTDGIRDNASEVSDNSKVGNDILEMSSQNLFARQRDADDRQLGMGDHSEYSFATMEYCAACNNYSDLSTQDSFSTNTKDTWTQVHFSDIIKEMKKQMQTRAEAAEEEEYSSFLKRHTTGDSKKKRKARSRNTMRNEQSGQYRRGREMNFNYDKPVQNYLINSARQNTGRRNAQHDDDDTFDCCGCMRFRFFRRIFNRFN